ncbi:GNAT family N-acetyltransferase [Streptomyces vilmorinianum]|uniref:GNAT family N-acetyltransferase n=1 Tax=Streptomyces vilmorinianum TaxID=3051092 RepID=UPI0010FB3009|nr:GNAT family N-acetyltransferase [Streptomyces vilmorinianum]
MSVTATVTATATATVAVRQLSPAGFGAATKGLADVLADAVAGGASLGFLQPFDHEDAAAWWTTRRPEVDAGSLLVWVAEAPEAPDGIVGTVSLALEPKPNGRHRAEIVKLMVHRTARGQGLARRLLATAEAAAREAGITLLLLDTETAGPAAHLYTATGWTPFGTVPSYATNPSGALKDCTFFYKRLA